MSKEEIKNNVVEILEDLLDDDSIEVNEETSRENCEAWDSLLHMAFMAAVADEFGISISTDEIIAAKDVKDVVDLVERHQ